MSKSLGILSSLKRMENESISSFDSSLFEGQNSLDIYDYFLSKVQAMGYIKRGNTNNYVKTLTQGPSLIVRGDPDRRKSKDDGLFLTFSVSMDGKPIFKDWEYVVEGISSTAEIDLSFVNASKSFHNYVSGIWF